jgi:hypothetical protein
VHVQFLFNKSCLFSQVLCKFKVWHIWRLILNKIIYNFFICNNTISKISWHPLENHCCIAWMPIINDMVLPVSIVLQIEIPTVKFNWELIGFWTLSVVRKSKIMTFQKLDLLPSSGDGRKQIELPKRRDFRFPDDGQSPETC